MSETAKYKHLTTPYCVGAGVDIASQGAAVVPWAMSFDLPGKEFLHYSSGQPPKGPIHLRGHAEKLPFESGSLDFVYCLKPDQRVTTPFGLRQISSIKAGDYVLGATGFTEVTRTFCRPFRGRVVTLETSQGILEVTKNHPIATPFGWSRADELRESSVIVHSTSQIEFSDFGNGIQIFSSVGRDFKMPSSSSSTLHVPKCDSSFAKISHQFGLSFFSENVRNKYIQKGFNSRAVSLQEKTISGFSPSVPAHKLSLVNRHFNSVKRRDFFSAIEQSEIAVGDLYGWNNAAFSGESETDTALSINNSSQPSYKGLRFGRVHCVSTQTYNGEVCNLETRDHTFFSEGILTHNCSHLLEDFEDWLPILAEWCRCVTIGGNIIILIPDKELWNEAIRRGQPPNNSHRHEGRVGELTEVFHRYFGHFEVLEDRLTALTPEDYTIMFVARRTA